jgi:hypothetical protein
MAGSITGLSTSPTHPRHFVKPVRHLQPLKSFLSLPSTLVWAESPPCPLSHSKILCFCSALIHDYVLPHTSRMSPTIHWAAELNFNSWSLLGLSFLPTKLLAPHPLKFLPCAEPHLILIVFLVWSTNFLHQPLAPYRGNIRDPTFELFAT